jgi:hypothetical protein
MFQFFKQHVWGSALLVGSGALTVASRLNDVYTVFNAGLPNGVWQAIGMAIFFATIIVLLAKWHQTNVTQPSPSKSASPAAGIKTEPTFQKHIGHMAPLTTTLKVWDMRADMSKLRADRYIEFTFRVFNASGEPVEIDSMVGNVAVHCKKADFTRDLPSPSVRSDTDKVCQPWRDWNVVLTQNVPAAIADSIADEIEQGGVVSFDFENLSISANTRDSEKTSGRLSLWDAIKLFNGTAMSRVTKAAGHELGVSSKFGTSPSPSKPDVNLSNAIWRVFLGEWTLPTKSVGEYGEKESQRFLKLVHEEFRQKAFDGELPVWGRRDGSTLVEPVPREFWHDHHVHYLTMNLAGGPDVDIVHEHSLATVRDWRDLRTSKDCIDRLYGGEEIRNGNSSRNRIGDIAITAGDGNKIGAVGHKIGRRDGG